MASRPRYIVPLVIGLILLVGFVPIGIYWRSVGRFPTVTVREAKELLSDRSNKAVLVDVRTEREYAAGHLDGAVNWPLATIQATASADAIPAQLAGRKLLLICASGWRSAKAVAKLQQLSIAGIFSVHGGLQEWQGAAGPVCPVGMVLVHTGPGSAEPVNAYPSRQAPLHEQWAAVITGFGVKPFYMLLSVVLALVLRRHRTADLAALRWGLWFFFIGEALCAANYLVYGERSYLFEYLHSYGMVLAFGFTAYAVMEGLDLRLIHYSDRKDKCAAAGLCRQCIKHTDAPCGLRRVFLMLIPATLALATLPLCAPFRTNAYNTRILGTPYSYLHAVTHQMFEIRYLPLAAIVLLLMSLLVLALKERHPVSLSKMLFAAGVGALGFSFFRLMLLAPFSENQVWFATWEEVTELLYVLTVGAVLWVFRGGLFSHAQAQTLSGPAAQ